MQNLCILGSESFFFFNILLEVLWQDISSFISFVLLIINLKVVSWQFLSLIYLFRAHTLCIYEALEVIVVYKHKDFMLAIF